MEKDISICESKINPVKKDNSSENQAPQNEIIYSKGNNESDSSSSSTTLLIDHSSKNSLLQTVQVLISSAEEMSNSMKIEKRILFEKCSQKSFITKQLKEQLNLEVLKTEQMFVKTFASSEPTLQNLEIVEVKIANVKNSSYKIINTLDCMFLSCHVRISECTYCKESI